MTDTAWVAFGSATAGAMVGGAATAIGSYLAGMGDRRHGARAVIYLSLLPEFKVAPRPVGMGVHTTNRSDIYVMDDILRTATVAGGRCFRRAERLRRAFDHFHRDIEPDEPMKTSGGGSQFPDREADKTALDTAVADFDRWLARKLS